ncbi:MULTISPECIES: hypothetical protein [unclassified Nocardioides]|uniref:hypothetical protein n=1 Tax=unclassified Nocardioides TaxID=2615069 RepID=UPI0012E344F7|nr:MULTISPECIES: hypothetical protein [unclassified Nocardioides]
MLLVETPPQAVVGGRVAALLRQRPGHVVVAMAVLTCLLGWLPFMGRPLSPDESGLLMVARQWAPGDSLYGDYWVDRPPVLIALVALGNLFGGAWGLRILGIVAVFTSVLLAGRLGRVVAPHVPTAALLPAATAAILVGTPLFGGTVVNAELLGLPLLLAGMIAAVTASRSAGFREALWWGTAAGAAGAGAVLTKQNLLDVLVFLLALLITGGLTRQGRAHARTALATALGAALGGATVLVVVVSGAAALGTDPVDLWSAAVTFRWEAASVVLESPSSGERFRLMLLALLGSGAPLLVGVLLPRLRRRAVGAPAHPDFRLPVLAVLTWESAAVVAGGSYWLHYLMGLVPGLVLLAAVTGLPDRVRASLALTYGLLVVSTLCSIGWVAVHPIDRPEQEVATYLSDRAQPGDTAMVAFGVSSILESSGLESPYPHLWSLPVRVRDPQLHELAAVLAGPDRPTWLVISGIGLGSWGLDTTAAQPLIARHYDRLADVAGYRIFRESEARR